MLTDGPAVAELCAAANFAPDPQQALALDMIFAVGANGLPASFAFGVVCCRQNLKTGLFKQAAVGWLYITDERTVVWSAHQMDTTLDAQKDLELLLTETPALAKRLPAQKNHGVYFDNGSERIELATGQRIKFKARTASGGRGLSGDKVILDEAFALRPAHVGSLLPTMTARPQGQVLYGSSAGMADSTVLADVRDRGRAGSSPRLSYVEWLAPREKCSDAECVHPKDAVAQGIDCALDREHLWRAANPTITTGRINIQTIADLRQELPPEEFMRESLGWWEDPTGPGSLVMPAWPLRVTPGTPVRPAALGVAMDVDRVWLSCGVASTGEVPHLGPVTSGDAGRTLRVRAADPYFGRAHFVDTVAQISKRYRLPVGLDRKGPAADLEADLVSAGARVLPGGLDDYAMACAELYDAVERGTITHGGYAELDESVAGAGWRKVGDRRVWARQLGEISMLEAVTWALWASTHHPPRRAAGF